MTVPRVEIVKYDPKWPQVFEQLRERLLPACGDLPVGIEHVGSTAVAGLAAKPIIDIDLVAERPDDIPLVIERMARLGYAHQGDLGVTGREAFRQPGRLPEHHLYAVVRGNAAHRNHIQLRDYLRLHPKVAARYAELKFELSERYGADRDGYTQAKSEFIDGVRRDASHVEELLSHYPLLTSIQETMWDSTEMRFVFELQPPTPDLIGNVRCAGFSGDRVLVIESEEFGLSAFPGGVLEPWEDWRQALERELLEEAGARPLSVEVVGRLHFWSGFDAPYRPHLPHPEFQQVVTHAEVELVGPPTNPPDDEHVLSVELIPIDEAIERLRGPNRFDLRFDADLLSFVRDVRGTS